MEDGEKGSGKQNIHRSKFKKLTAVNLNAKTMILSALNQDEKLGPIATCQLRKDVRD